LAAGGCGVGRRGDGLGEDVEETRYENRGEADAETERELKPMFDELAIWLQVMVDFEHKYDGKTRVGTDYCTGRLRKGQKANTETVPQQKIS
jgi:hypothetical protein